MSSLKRNFIYNLSHQFLLLVIPLIIVPYISRVLGPENIGIYSYTHSVANYFVLFSMLGLLNYGNRSISRVRNNKNSLSETFWNIYALQFTSAIIMILLYIVFILFIDNDYKVIAFLQLIYVASSLTDINWFFYGLEKFKYTVVINIITKIISIISIFTFVNEENDLKIYVLIMAMAALMSHLLLWPLIRKHIYFVKPTFEQMKLHIKPNLTLFIPVIAISIYNLMDKVMVGQLSTMVELGYYENTSKIINIPFGIITALGTVMIPRMSNMFAEGKTEDSTKYINISMKFILIVSSALMFGLSSVSHIFAPLFFGQEFLKVGTFVLMSSPIIVFKAWANVIRTQILIPRMRDKEYINSVISGAVVNFIVNLFLISRYGAIGAVIGTVVAEATVSVFQTIVIKDELDVLFYIKDNFFFVINGFIMFIIIRSINLFFPYTFILLFIDILIGALYYLTTSGLYLYYKKDKIFMKYVNRIF